MFFGSDRAVDPDDTKQIFQAYWFVTLALQVPLILLYLALLVIASVFSADMSQASSSGRSEKELSAVFENLR